MLHPAGHIAREVRPLDSVRRRRRLAGRDVDGVVECLPDKRLVIECQGVGSTCLWGRRDCRCSSYGPRRSEAPPDARVRRWFPVGQLIERWRLSTILASDPTAAGGCSCDVSSARSCVDGVRVGADLFDTGRGPDDRTCGRDWVATPDAVGCAGSARGVGLPFHHALGTSRRAGGQRVSDRGRSGEPRTGDP